MPSIYHMEYKKYISIKVVAITYTPEKGLLQLLLFEVYESFLLTLWSVSDLSTFLEKNRPYKYYLREANLFFLLVYN